MVGSEGSWPGMEHLDGTIDSWLARKQTNRACSLAKELLVEPCHMYLKFVLSLFLFVFGAPGWLGLKRNPQETHRLRSPLLGDKAHLREPGLRDAEQASGNAQDPTEILPGGLCSWSKIKSRLLSGKRKVALVGVLVF